MSRVESSWMLLARAEVRAGNVAEALTLLSHAQHSNPAETEPWQFAAALAAQVRDWPVLEDISCRWTLAHPRSVEAWQTLSRAYFEQSRFSPSIAAFEHVLELEADKLAHRVSAARLATAAQQYNTARFILEKVLQQVPDSPDVLYALARVYHLTGEIELAERYCRRSITLQPGYPPAYTTLGLLREGRLEDADINIIEKLIAHPAMHAEYKAMLGFTLGDALDRRGNYAGAFAAWEAANQINLRISEQEGIVYDRAAQDAEVMVLDQLFAEEIIVEKFDNTSDATPIFVVGMPRSGTTLAESVFASHSQVTGAGELPTLCAIHDELMTVARQQGISAARDTLIKNAANWRARYLEALPAHGEASYVVDKQPLNFRSVGLIRVLFPDSPIIYTQRAALDIGFSIFRNNFTKNWPCAHRLSDIAHYLGVHARTMSLWQQRFPGLMHVLDHAAMVRDPSREIRALLVFAGLDVEAACLTPHQTQRPIATFSAVQVRRPVSAAYTGRAARYLPWLGGLVGVGGIGVGPMPPTPMPPTPR